MLTRIGLFYGAHGALMIPALGIVESYGGYTPEYYNAMGFFVLSKYIVSSSYNSMAHKWQSGPFSTFSFSLQVLLCKFPKPYYSCMC